VSGRPEASHRRASSLFPPPSSLSIRFATLADLDTVVELRLALLREHEGDPVYGRLRDDAPEQARRIFGAQLQAAHEVTLLADRAGKTVGILRCVEASGNPLLHPARYGYVASVYVRPEARRRGVLKCLVTEAEAWCVRRGLEEMRLHSASGSALSNAAWDGLGFEVVEHLRLRRIDPHR
jgi:ribosomal protein S18 acetylase RimI-like enzyme